MAERLRADEGDLYNVAGEYLVNCPRCGKCAVSRKSSVVCAACGYVRSERTKESTGGSPAGLAPTDPYWGLELWLQIPCEGHILWAYDLWHLSLIEDYVRAKHRSSGAPGARSWRRKLPLWIKSAKNRDAVLKAIERLKAKV